MHQNYQTWLKTKNSQQIEDFILTEGFNWIDSLQTHYGASKPLTHPNDLTQSTGWRALGVAKKTRHKDKITYRSKWDKDKNDIDHLLIQFNCFQGGVDVQTFNSSKVLYDRYLRERHDGLSSDVINPISLSRINNLPETRLDIAIAVNETITNAITTEKEAKRKAEEETEEKRKAEAVKYFNEVYESLPSEGASLYFSESKHFPPDFWQGHGFRFGNDAELKYIQNKKGNFVAVQLRSAINGEPLGLQIIYDDGTKKLTYGTKKSKVPCTVFGDIEQSKKLIFTESVANSIVINKTVVDETKPNVAVIFCVDAENLKKVVKEFAERYPDKEGIVVCDNDKWKYDRSDNVGVLKGVEAAINAGYKCVISNFDEYDQSNQPTDIWDLYHLGGIEAVAELLDNPPSPPKGHDWHKLKISLTGLRDTDATFMVHHRNYPQGKGREAKKALEPLYQAVKALCASFSNRIPLEPFDKILDEISICVKSQSTRLSQYPRYDESEQEKLLEYAEHSLFYIKEKGTDVIQHDLELIDDKYRLTDVDGKECGQPVLKIIDAEGDKKNAYSKGICYIIESDEVQDQPPIIICEKIPTGLSLRKAIPHAKIYCALNAGNLLHIAKAVRQKYPEAEIKIACDNDESGTGLVKGDEAAQKCKGTLLLPQEIGDDFNDVMVKHGISRVIDSLSIQGIKPLNYYIFRHYPKKTIDECISEYLKDFGKDYHFSKKSIELIRKRAIRLAGIKEWRLEKETYEYYSGLENITVEELHDRYIPHDFTIEEGITVLSTPMGSGKTQLIKRDAAKHPDERLAYIAPLINLVKTLAEALGFTYYQAENAYQAKRIATTLHSLYKFIKENEPIHTLYIDEIEQILQAFIGNAIQDREKIFEAFCTAIRQAKHIVIADAFVSQETLHFIRTLRPQDKIKLLIPGKEKRQDGKGRKIIRYEDYKLPDGTQISSEQVLINKVLETISLGGRPLIVCNSKKQGEKINLAIKRQYPDKKGIVINSKTSYDERDFVMNINQQIDQYDYVIYSPSLASGISIDEIVKPFDLVACFIHGTVGTWLDAWQLISRYRKPMDYHVWIRDYNNESPIDPHQIWDNYHSAINENDKELSKRISDIANRNRNIDNQATASKLVSEVLELASDVLKKSAFRNHLFNDMVKAAKEKRVYEQSGFDHLYCQREAQENKLTKNFKANFLLMAKIRGFEITRALETAEFNMRAVDKMHHQLRIENLMNAPDITDQEYEDMKNAPGLTALQHDQMERYALRTFYPDTPITPDTIAYDDEGRKRKSIRHLELANRSRDYLAKQDIDDQAAHTVVLNKHRMLLQNLIRNALEVVGARFESDGSISIDGREIDIHSKAAKKFLKWVDKKRNAIDALKICKTRNDMLQNSRWFLDLLRALGLGIEKEKNQGNRSYYISVGSIKVLNEYLVRRFERFTDKYFEQLILSNLCLENNEVEQFSQGALPSIDYIKEEASTPFFKGKYVGHILESLKQAKSDDETIEILDANEITQKDDRLWEVVSDTLNDFKDANLNEVVINYLLTQPVSEQSATPSKAPQLTKTNASWANPELIWHQRLQDFYLNVKKGVMEEWLKIKNTNPLKWNELKAELERYQLGYQYAPNP